METEARIRLLGALVAVTCMACGPSLRIDADGGDGDDDADASPTADAPPGFIDGAPPVIEEPPVDKCSSLQATVRDFKKVHPDFETFTRDEIFPGIIQPLLGTDGKPVYAHPGATLHTTGPGNFAQWYHDVPNVNQAVPVVLELTETTPGLFVYESNEFFPIDGMGFGDDGFPHNFHFTTEIHTSFKYSGGEIFTFRGDDDLWLFINGKLAIDLGGLHQPALQTVNLDARAVELGLSVGGTYSMEIFHAERHTTQSNFRIETTIECFIIP